jgi:hypothetical protein
MTKESNDAGPDLIVLGLDETRGTRAGRFPASQAKLVTKAVEAMNFTVGKAESEALAEIAKKLPTGRLYANGRAFVPPVRKDYYVKILEQLQLAGQAVPAASDRSVDGQPAPELPVTWDDIEVGHLVIAHEGAWEGWWEAIVVARDGDMLTLKWRDYQQPNVMRHIGSIALLKSTPAST